MAGVHEILGANGDVAKHDGFDLPGSGPACNCGRPVTPLAAVSRSIKLGSLARKPTYGAPNARGSACAPLILTSVQLEYFRIGCGQVYKNMACALEHSTFWSGALSSQDEARPGFVHRCQYHLEVGQSGSRHVLDLDPHSTYLDPMGFRETREHKHAPRIWFVEIEASGPSGACPWVDTSA